MKAKPVFFILLVVAAFAFSGVCSAQTSKFDPSKIDFSKAKVIGVGVDASLPSLGAAASHIKTGKDASYSFTTGVSPEKGSFQLGALLADLQVAAQSGDRERTKAACSSLIRGLDSLGAPDPLVSSASNLLAAVSGSVDLNAVAQLARPLIYPQVKAFVEEQGKLTYLFLGEWSETVYLASAMAGKGGKGDLPLDLAVRAATFAKELQKEANAPSGAVKALNDIAKLAEKKEMGAREAGEMLKAAENLKMLFS